MAKTTADVPPQVAKEYGKASRSQAVSEATGDGYTKTKKMQQGQKPASKSQFGLPPSPGKGMPMGPGGKGPGVKLRIHVIPDDGM